MHAEGKKHKAIYKYASIIHPSSIPASSELMITETLAANLLDFYFFFNHSYQFPPNCCAALITAKFSMISYEPKQTLHGKLLFD